MESENELNPIDIKNHACYYFDHIMRVIHFNSRDILLNEKKAIYGTTYITYKTFMGSIPLRIRLDEIDGFIKIYDEIRYLALFS